MKTSKRRILNEKQNKNDKISWGVPFKDFAKLATFLHLFGFWMFISTFGREIAKHLSLPPVKLHCSMLAEDAIKAAVKDYEAKRGAQPNASAQATPLEKAADAWFCHV